jgi:hypothetical protein
VLPLRPVTPLRETPLLRPLESGLPVDFAPVVRLLRGFQEDDEGLAERAPVPLEGRVTRFSGRAPLTPARPDLPAPLPLPLPFEE